MKYKIIHNKKNNYLKIKHQLENKLPTNFIKSEEPEVVISIGGDGTFIRAVNECRRFNPLFITINNGRLGFYCEYEAHEVQQLINDLLNKDHLDMLIPLIETKVNNKTIYSVNELTLMSLIKTTEINLFINNVKLFNFRGTGLSFSTQMGSTGFAKTMGGSIILQNVNVLQMVEIAGINNNTYRTLGSPLIMSPNTKINIEDISSPINLISDGTPIIALNSGKIELSTSNEKIKLLKRKQTNYIEKLRNSFIKN